MLKAESSKFRNMRGSETLEVRTNSAHDSELLGYIDYSADGKRATVEVFTPYSGHARTYAERPTARAESILDRHLATLGYTR